MSLILEALRKSESERRQGVAPGLLQPELVPAPAVAPRVPRWAWLAPILLAMPLLWWWSRDKAPADTARPAVDATAANPPETAVPQPARPLPPVERLQAAPPAPPPRPAPTRSPPREPATPTVVAAPVAAPAPAPAGTPLAGGPDPVALGALSPGQREALPPLQLSMHLWNEDPARRVAILDGRRVAAGDRVGPATVAEIRRDGVLLDWNGTPVLVPLR